MITGGVTTIIWKSLATHFPQVVLFGLYEIVPGFLLALLVIYIVSSLDQKGQQVMANKFKKMNL